MTARRHLTIPKYGNAGAYIGKRIYHNVNKVEGIITRVVKCKRKLEGDLHFQIDLDNRITIDGNPVNQMFSPCRNVMSTNKRLNPFKILKVKILIVFFCDACVTLV